MDESRFITDLIGRLHGPLTFRLILQPVMAILYATRDGLRDARGHRPAYFWALFTGAADRSELLQEAWKAVARVIALGVVMDVIYQFIVFRWLYPVELIIVVLLLAVVPYVLLRGPINRIARMWMGQREPVR